MKKINHVLRSISSYQHLRAISCFFLGALCAFQVSAVTVADSAFEKFMFQTVGAGQQSITFGGGGQPIVTAANGNLALEGADLVASRTGTIYNPSGNPYQITAKAKVGAAAVGALALKALPFVTYLGAGVALYDFFKSLGYDAVKSSDGSVSVSKETLAGCSAYCYEYSGGTAGGWFLDPVAACKAHAAVQGSGIKYNSVQSANGAPYATSYGCIMTFSNGAGFLHNLGIRNISPYGAQAVPMSMQELADSIAAKSGWPSGSKVAEAVKQAQELNGEAIKTETPTVTGPATTQGPVKQEQKADGKTVTSTTTHNHNYAGNKITISNVTNVSVYNPATNQTETETTTETPKTEPTECEKNPESLGCLKPEFDTPDGEIPKATKNITYQAENLGLGGGACPADKNLNISGIGSVTAFDWGESCGYITSYVKPMILALAGFAALMIIFVGVKIE